MENVTKMENVTFGTPYSYPFALDYFPNVTVDLTKCPVPPGIYFILFYARYA